MASWPHRTGSAARLVGWLAPLRRVPPVFFVLAALLIAIAVINPRFTHPLFLMNFLKQSAPLMILAAGQLFVVVAGGFDLAVGSLITLVVLGSSLLIDGDPARTWWVIALMFALGALVGTVSGAVVHYLKVPSIITTLGLLITLKGVAMMWSGGAPKGYLPENYRWFGRAMLRDVPLVEVLPIALIVLVVVAAVGVWLMEFSNFGKHVRALGDNPRAARLAGVNVSLTRILAFVFSALSAVIAGVLLGGFAGVSTDVGRGYELQAISAVVLGGAQLLGGRGSMPTALAGALSLSALFTLLNILGLPKPLRDAVQGLILIAAVAYAMYRKRRSG